MLDSPINISQIIALYAKIFTWTSCVGLVIGVFELAFNRVYRQVMFRMAIHLLCIALSVYLYRLNVQSNVPDTLKDQTLALLSMCIMSVGSIGLIIGTIELGVIPATTSLLNRIILYVCCIFVALPFLPMTRAFF